jgi:hypothetical protein
VGGWSRIFAWAACAWGFELTASVAEHRPVLSTNFGSTELQTGTTPFPRSATQAAGVVDVPWWNNFMFLPEVWFTSAQAGPWILSDGTELAADSGFRVRAVTDPGIGTGASYFASKTVAMANNHELLFADHLRNTAARKMVGIEIEGLPAWFTQHGVDLYVYFQDTAFSTTGVYLVEVDAGLDGVINHTAYARQGFPDTVLNPDREFYWPDPGFLNHQSAQLAEVLA